MVFTSFEFVFFFLAILLVRSRIRNFVLEKWFLLLASYCFYVSWSSSLVVIILLTSVIDYQIGRRLEITEHPVSRKRLLFLSLATNLGILVCFKYANFILSNVFGALNYFGFAYTIPHLDLSLPAGISYFAFTSISYVVDVYYEKIQPSRSVLDHALFIAYFPKLLAGPIVRAAQFLPQLQQRALARIEDIEAGLAYVLVGAVKKLVISDQIAGHVGLIFASPREYDSLTLLQGVLGYSVQIYCDFSGYSDIAIGCARLMGFRLPENFQFPYSASSISEFWRRWHITLSAWFRDYVFLPLELATRSRRSATARTSLNLLCTMLLCGLWHGAGWNFVIWGGIHGAALGIHKMWSNWNPLGDLSKGRAAPRLLWGMASRFLTLSVVVLAWIFFRAETFSDAWAYLTGLLVWRSEGTRLLSPYILPAILGVIVVHLFVNKNGNWTEELIARPAFSRVVAYSCLLALVVFLAATDAAPFIYFQF